MSALLSELPEECRADFRLIDECFDEEDLKRQGITEWKGRKFEPDFPADTIRYAYDNHMPKQNEVMIASFPKTGTTWTREIVRQILYGEDERLDRITRDLSFPILYLESGSPSKFNVVHNLPIPRRYCVTHLPADLLNMRRYLEMKMKIIYTLRNPKDRLVSFFHHLQNFPAVGDMKEFAVKDWNSYFDQELQGKYPNNLRDGETYVDHIFSWLPYIRGKQALMVVYEEMIQSPGENIKRIAEFLQVPISVERVKAIAKSTSIKSMKKRTENSKSQDAQFLRNFGLLRKGKVGGWKDYFTVTQSELLDKQVEEKLRGTGIDFIYEIC